MSTMIIPKADAIWGWRYRFVTLENGLKVMIVSDPTCDKAACSLDVGIGSMHDGPNFPGLGEEILLNLNHAMRLTSSTQSAHFLEHMLFYASEKYPLEDEYSKFISDHGGRTSE